MTEQDISYLARIVERELARPDLALRPHPELMALFDTEYSHTKSRETVIACLVGLALFNAFIIFDFAYRKEFSATALWLQLGLVTAPCLIGLWWIRDGASEFLRNAVISFESIAATTAVCAIFAATHTAMDIHDPFAFILIPLVTNTLAPIRFRFAFAAAIANFCITAATLLTSPVISHDAMVMTMSALAFTSAVTLFSNYRFEKNAIQTFLNLLQKSLHQIEMKETNRKLYIISREDPLTGLANRREFDNALVRMWSESAEKQTVLSVLMIDVDHFKSYNDHYGHPAGDECLRKVALAIRNHVRATTDVAARVGGEEFCILMPGCDAATATRVAERIRRAVESLQLAHKGASPRDTITVSIGTATAKAGKTNAGDLVAAADRALYDAKHAGRNQNRHVDLDIAA